MTIRRILISAVLSMTLAPLFAQNGADLVGKVVDEAGAAIPEASVFIYTAGPRVGPGYI